ncbi:MAG: lysophospholipid acyltransferase family protein [Candidatus Aminicenantales bacterium]
MIYLFLTLLLCPLLLFCYPFRIRSPFFAIGKWAMHLSQRILGLQLEVRGAAQIEKKTSYVFMANHLSFMDGPLLFMLIPQTVRVLLKKEAFRVPIIGQTMRLVGFIPVDRRRFKGGKASIEKAARMMKKEVCSFLIFPEGTRSRDGRIQPFKRGGFLLALQSQAPIVPVSIQGTYELMPRGSFFVKKGKILVTFHPPIPAKGYHPENLPELIERVKSEIQSGLEK